MLKKDVTLKMLKAIATMMNKVLGYKDPILTGKGVLRKDLYDEVADAAQDIEPGDLEHEDFTDDMVIWLGVMGWEKPGEKAIESEEVVEEEPKEESTEDPEPPAEKESAKEKIKPVTKKKAGPKKASTTGPGVIASILEFVTEFGPITKDEVVSKLSERFKDRDPVAMAKTVQAQLPKRMSKEKGINIVAGFYIK